MEEQQRRRYYSISKVADLTGLKQHILRFWESEFPILKPRKNRAGNRAYTERDIKIVQLIKRLLYEEKYTIDGAKNRLKTDRQFIDNQLSLPLITVDRKVEIQNIRSNLLKLMEMIEDL